MPQIDVIPKSIENPTNLPYDDGVPLESPIHRENMNVLIDSAKSVMGNRKDFFAGGNMFLYYNLQKQKNKDFRGPDFFFVKDVDRTKERKSWILWEENWKFPDVIVELLSESTYKIDLVHKKELYENTFRTPEYYVYDPYKPESLQGWRLNQYGFYEELAKSTEGWLWSRELNCWLGVWSGKMTEESKTYLRMYDKQKKLILLEFERERLEKEREHERAERERLEKEKEHERAERERLEKEKALEELRELKAKMGIL
ncbi:MAG: Uma2 family endonuclease [Leptospiraceae bacterium]|nr:Uma2 family endonuclease [Leptospiraceae bacterium]MCP5493741.1 Uma2 family endonuclease [Leptospiraceae bacterium]